MCRTVRNHVEGEIARIDERQIVAKHPLWQWCAWWASSILNRYVARPDGRATYELITGHQTKMLVVSFGQHVLWSSKSCKRQSIIVLQLLQVVGVGNHVGGQNLDIYIWGI